MITNAYQLLKKLIINKNQTNHTVSFDHYIIAIQRLNVAVIFLDERPYKGEDPQIIFETLNSLGKPLTLSDLVRNYVLLKLESENQTEIYEKIWYPKIEETLGDNTSKFIRDYLQYKTSSSLKVVSDNNTKELYQQFKDFFEKNFNNNYNDFIEDIVKYVPLYKWIINEINNDPITKNTENYKIIKELLRNIFHDIKSEAFKPFVLGLLEYHQYGSDNNKLIDEQLISNLEIIRTYLIRRRILGLTKGENKSIVKLCENVKDVFEEKIKLIELLCNMFYAMRLPNDEEITSTLKTINFYEELKAYSKFILGKIEEHNSKVSVDFRDPKITIEHIMPQKIDENWKNELGPDYERIHKKYLHNIGNLILTEFNSEIGNKSSIDKKEKIKKSNLYYRHLIINFNKWNETSIIEHQNEMINLFINTFPLPEDYKNRNNWREEITEKETFSTLESEAGNIAEGNKPIELSINSKSIKVKTWQDVFIELLKYIKKDNENNFQFILENQYELFKRDDVIVKWSKLKGMLEVNLDLSSRYKTFDGKTWDKVEDLKDDTIFIHVNFSASTCMARIASIMEKLFFAEESVQINLK